MANAATKKTAHCPMCGHALKDPVQPVDNAGIALTERQTQVVTLLAQGIRTKEIAEILKTSPRTVEFHRWMVMRRLRLKTPVDLVKYAMSQKLLDYD